MNGVIDIATGDLLRVGFADFSADGSLDTETEAVRTDVPEPAYPRYFPGTSQMHRWDGAQWTLVSQPSPEPSNTGTAPNSYYESSTSSATLTSGTGTLIPGMDITPPAGTYYVVFDADVDPPSTAAQVVIAIDVSVVAESVRDIDLSIGQKVGISTQARVTVNGSQSIRAGYIGTSSATFGSRSLVVIAVENN